MARRRYPECVGRRGQPRPRTLAEIVSIPHRSPLAEELGPALAAAARLHVLETDLAPVPVRPTATTSEAGAYRYRRHDPIDLRVSARSDRVALSFLHELGHLVDHQLHCEPKGRVWASAVHPAFSAWRSAAAGLAGRRFPGGRSRGRYFQSAQEVWARSYAQTVLLRSDDRLLEAQVERLQAADDPFVWPAQTFEPVALEVERVFERLGLTQLTLPLAA